MPVPLIVGDQLVIADMAWFGGGFRSGHELAVVRPGIDTQVAPKAACQPGSLHRRPGETPPPQSWPKMLGIHIKAAIQWQQLSNGDWTTYAAEVSQRTPGNSNSSNS